MTTLSPDLTMHTRLAELILSLPPHEAEWVQFSIEEHELVMEGRVPSYEAKRRMVTAARAYGFLIQNCLRVTPSLVFDSSPPPGTVVLRKTRA